MEQIRLGSTGLKVSRLCLGTLTFGKGGWRGYVLSEEDSRPILQRAVELGITFFDTSNSYSVGVSEEVLGRALKDFARREQVVIATKAHRPVGDGANERGLSRKHLMAAIDASLTRLGTDYVDLFQIHRWDEETPIEETLEALHDIVKAGKARYIGACTMYAWQFAKALYLSRLNGWQRFVSMQCHHNLIYRENEREMFPLCREEGIGILPYSPLARGLLTASKDAAQTRASTRGIKDDLTDMLYRDSNLDICDRVVQVAKQLGTPPARVALAWVLQQEGVTSPIVGASSIKQLDDTVQALDVHLDAAAISYLNEAYKSRAPIMI